MVIFSLAVILSGWLAAPAYANPIIEGYITSVEKLNYHCDVEIEFFSQMPSFKLYLYRSKTLDSYGNVPATSGNLVGVVDGNDAYQVQGNNYYYRLIDHNRSNGTWYYQLYCDYGSPGNETPLFYPDSIDLTGCWFSHVVSASANAHHTACIDQSLKALVIGLCAYGECEISGWGDLVQISAGQNYTIGVESDGTLVAAGDNSHGQCDIDTWTGILQVSAGSAHTVGLNEDGAAVAVGNNSSGQCGVGAWCNLMEVQAGVDHTVGLKRDLTAVAVGNNDTGACDVGEWRDIKQIAAGTQFTVGLKLDGAVAAVGNNHDGQCNVGDWTDIVQVSAGAKHTVGLKSDGTVVAAGYNGDGQCNVSDWCDIIQVEAGSYHTVGIKKDGTLVAVGKNDYKQSDVYGWDLILGQTFDFFFDPEYGGYPLGCWSPGAEADNTALNYCKEQGYEGFQSYNLSCDLQTGALTWWDNGWNVSSGSGFYYIECVRCKNKISEEPASGN
jgi:hypothetical protein